MPRGLRGVLPTCMSSDTHTDLSPSCEPWNALWIGSSPNRSWSWRPRRTDLDSHPQMREPLWKSGSPAEKFQHTVREKKFEMGWIKEGERISLTLPASHFPQGSKAQWQENLLRPMISPPWESGSVWVSTCLPWPKCWTCQRGPFLSCHIQSTELWAAWLGSMSKWENRNKGLEWNILKDGGSPNYTRDPFGRHIQEPLGMLHLQIPQLPVGTHSTPCALSTFPTSTPG